MAWSAELRDGSTQALLVTGTSDGKSPPTYVWADGVEPDSRLAMEGQLAAFYSAGLYGTGSPGQVRDMLHAMDRLSDDSKGWIALVVPQATQRKAAAEAKADAAALPEGAVW